MEQERQARLPCHEDDPEETMVPQRQEEKEGHQSGPKSDILLKEGIKVRSRSTPRKTICQRPARDL